MALLLTKKGIKKMPHDYKKHDDYLYMLIDDDKFINPYNFVSFPNKIKRSDYVPGNLTGHITVSLKTKTPLFIPNTTNDDYFRKGVENHKSFDFYSYVDLKGKTYNGKCYSPVIPGSELRGVLRMIHEIQNDSCFEDLIDRNRTFAKREPPKGKKGGTDDSFQPCLIFWDDKKGEYYYVDADSYKLENEYYSLKGKNNNGLYDRSDKLINDDCSITPDEMQEQEIVYYRKGEKFGNKKPSEKVFVVKDVTRYYLTPVEVLCFKNTLGEYADERINNHLKTKEHSGYIKLRERFLNHRPIVAFIKKVEGFNQISPAAIGKYMLKNTLDDILRKGGYEGCSDIHDSCSTCQLFGFINKDNNNSHSSRIRITDATTSMNPDECYLEPLTLKSLLSPHPSYALFYGAKNNGKNRLDKWYDKGLPLGNISIRGRKLYFHSKFDSDLVTEAPSKLNNTIHPVKEGVVFTYDIYFDEITKEQLEQLIKCINLYNDGKDEGYGHKIGHGKPLGLGSVFMKVEKVTFRRINRSEDGIQYCEISDEEWKEQDASFTLQKSFDAVSLQDKQLKIMTDISMKNEKVCYPYSQNDENGYSWFVNNNAPQMYENKKCQHLPILQTICDNKDVKEKLKLKSNTKQRQ